jgi:hypothetical protein
MSLRAGYVCSNSKVKSKKNAIRNGHVVPGSNSVMFYYNGDQLSLRNP